MATSRRNVRFTPESGHRNRPAYYLRRTNSGSLAMFAAIRRASALLIVDFEFGGIARKPLLLLGKSVVTFSVT
jgi:hypothetical protein